MGGTIFHWLCHTITVFLLPRKLQPWPSCGVHPVIKNRMNPTFYEFIQRIGLLISESPITFSKTAQTARSPLRAQVHFIGIFTYKALTVVELFWRSAGCCSPPLANTVPPLKFMLELLCHFIFAKCSSLIANHHFSLDFGYFNHWFGFHVLTE